MITEDTIGTFTLASRTLLVSDPGYAKESRGAGQGQQSYRAMPGSWVVKLHRDASTLVALEAHHERFPTPKLRKAGKVFVDSGMMSIYDRKAYRSTEEVEGVLDEETASSEMARMIRLYNNFGQPKPCLWNAVRCKAGLPLLTPHGVMLCCGDDGEYPVLIARAFKREGVVRLMVIFDEEVLG